MVQEAVGSNPISHPNLFNDLAVFDNLDVANLRDFCRAFVSVGSVALGLYKFSISFCTLL